MRYVLVLMACLAGQASAAPPGEKPQPTGQMAGDTVTQPLADVNLKRREIPKELLAIRDDPYALGAIRSCGQLADEVRKLDAVLGVDFDQVVAENKGQKRKESAAAVAGSLINGLVPFRGVIREVSGASRADEEYRAAIFAGVVRRGFLKGYGLRNGCRAPARPLTEREQVNQAEAIERAADEEKSK